MSVKKKSSLMTPDPYHTPGYCGFLPQFKYDVGQTFGSHTHKLLTTEDPKVAASGNSVLCEIFPNHASLPATKNVDFTDSPVYKNNTRSWGDQKYLPHMVPGYAGYVPKTWKHFGSRYAETCHNALTAFEHDQHQHRDKMVALRSITSHQDNPQSQRDTGGSGMTTTPLCPIRPKAKVFYPDTSKQNTHSPYCIPDNTQPTRHHMSGYMGFVPKTQRYMAQGYPIITSIALEDHRQETERQEHLRDQPVQIHRPPAKIKSSVEIYPKHIGLLPRYMGYVPGQKFRYAGTFGSSTRDTLRPVLV